MYGEARRRENGPQACGLNKAPDWKTIVVYRSASYVRAEVLSFPSFLGRTCL
jgi:hypothetical protein